MGRNNGMFRIRIDFEDIPITDEKTKGTIGLDSVISKIHKKFRGK